MNGRDDRWIYWALGGVVAVLAVIGLVAWNTENKNEEAQQKAEQLSQKFEQAGLPVPKDLDIFIRTLGDDGGAVCDNPGDALGKAALYDQISNGADFVGRRPVIIDRRVVLGELLILQTYCPDKLEDYRNIIDDLKTDNTIKD
jgi:hypothetical protein